MKINKILRGEAVAILARTLYGEARGQPHNGKVAVANVMLNRVRSNTWWGKTIVEVCLWPYQFSAWNTDDPNRKVMLSVLRYDEDNRTGVEFLRCLTIAMDAVRGGLIDNTMGSTHYINPKVADPRWARGKTPAITFGDHEFYNNID